MKPRLGNRRGARWARYLVPGLIIGIIALLLLGIFLSRRAAFAAPAQPIDFSHRTHDQVGLQCLYCHPNALRSDLAGIPSLQKCAGCHSIIATDRAQIQDLMGYWQREQPIPWQAVNQLPDFVFFSHQPHLGAGLNCETCHGEVGQMTVARPAVRMDMGWCLACHLDQPEDKVARLTDCLACH